MYKVKFALAQAMKVLSGGEWSTPRPGRLSPGKEAR
jgi:hypothetical protein